MEHLQQMSTGYWSPGDSSGDTLYQRESAVVG